MRARRRLLRTPPGLSARELGRGRRSAVVTDVGDTRVTVPPQTRTLASKDTSTNTTLCRTTIVRVPTKSDRSLLYCSLSRFRGAARRRWLRRAASLGRPEPDASRGGAAGFITTCASWSCPLRFVLRCSPACSPAARRHLGRRRRVREGGLALEPAGHVAVALAQQRHQMLQRLARLLAWGRGRELGGGVAPAWGAGCRGRRGASKLPRPEGRRREGRVHEAGARFLR